MNEEYTNAPEEVVVDQTSQNLVDQLQEPIQDDEPVVHKQSSAERNWRELREKATRLERERDELAKRVSQVEQYNRSPQPEPEPEFNVTDDELVEGKVLKKIVKNFEKKLYESQRQQQALTTEIMLKSRYSDFDNVVNDSSIQKLREKYPDVAASLHAQQDPYAKLSAAYSLIKDLKLNNVPEEPSYEEEKSAIARNAKQPRSAGSMAPQTGTTPLSQANDYAKRYSSKMDEKIRAEMEDIIRR